MIKDTMSSQRPSIRRYIIGSILPIVFLAVSLSIYCYNQIHTYQFIEKELEGTDIIGTLYEELTDLQKIRGYTQIAIQRNLHHYGDTEELKRRFLIRLQDRVFIGKVTELGLRDEVNNINRNAIEIFNSTSITSTDSNTLFEKYTNLISKIMQLMKLVANRSNLILDSELDTYYLIDILVRQIPALIEYIGRARGLGSGIIARGYPVNYEKRELEDLIVLIKSREKHLIETQELLAKAAPCVGKNINLIPKRLNNTLSIFFEECNKIEKDEAATLDPDHFFLLATKAIDLMYTPYKEALQMLYSRLKKRQKRQIMISMIAIIGTIIAMFIMLFFNRSFYLRNLRLHQRLAELSITDQLTSLYNRRHFFDLFPRELRRATRSGERLYIVLIDVDNFKKYNDTYGHPAGDVVLRKIAETMESSLKRAGDYAFRVGGEEFCMLFAAKDISGAVKIAERFRKAVEELQIQHEGNPPFGVVTISAGLIEADPDCSLEHLMSEVDKALYQAKEAGRNRVVSIEAKGAHCN